MIIVNPQPLTRSHEYMIPTTENNFSSMSTTKQLFFLAVVFPSTERIERSNRKIPAKVISSAKPQAYNFSIHLKRRRMNCSEAISSFKKQFFFSLPRVPADETT